MIPIQVKLHGFMSYRDEATLNFAGSPLWMLSGHNGAGKSTVFDAMKFALYGTHRRGTQHAEGLIHHDASSLRVEFDFQSGPDTYRIVRTLARGGRPTFQALHLKGPNSPRPGSSSPLAISETDSKAGLQRFVDTHICLNEETFSSAVMLQQGKSDALLSADADVRHALLSQIVDLTAFERLQERAEDGRKTAKAKVDILTNRLTSSPEVDEEAIQNLEEKLNRLREQIQTQRVRLETILQLKPEAQRWEELNAGIESLKTQINNQQNLLQQATQIRRDLARLGELANQLPKLREYVSLLKQVSDLEERAAALHAEQEIELQKIQQATEAKLAHLQRQEELEDKIKRHQKQREEANATLLDIAPKLPQQQSWTKLKEELAGHDLQLTQFDPDLSSLEQRAQAELKEVSDVALRLPFLKNLVQSREEWQKSLHDQRLWQDHLAETEQELRLTQEEIGVTETHLRQTENQRDEAQKRNTEAATLLQSAESALARFAQVEHEPTCHYCGQTLDDTHRAKEQARLQADLEAAQGRQQQASTALKEALLLLKTAQQQHQSAEDKGSTLHQQRQKAQHALESASLDIERASRTASQCVAELSPDWSTRVVENADEASGFARELTGTFPNQTQLQNLQAQAKRQAALQQQLADFAEQIQKRQRLQHQREDAQQRFQAMDVICRGYPLDLQQQYEATHKALHQAQRSIETATTQLNNETRSAQQEEEKAVKAGQSKNSLSIELAQIEGTLNHWRAQIEKSRETLPPEFLERPLDGAQLAYLENQKAHLEAENVRAKGEELDRVENEHKAWQQNLEHLESTRTKIPSEAQRPASQLQSEEDDLRRTLHESETDATSCESERSALVNAKAQRESWQKELREAEKSTRLHKEIADRLGRDGLQRQLLQEAEVAIIDGANEVLDRISSSELRLELQNGTAPEAIGTRRGASRALDFVVYNSQLGQSPTAMHPAFLSGSQRFRVAVSLALGIGHYASHGKGRVESVIIDEGFGSLDKQGRQEMIEELRELKSVLKRVILVSHQEEFSEAFANRYHIEVVDGTSRVGLLEANTK